MPARRRAGAPWEAALAAPDHRSASRRGGQRKPVFRPCPLLGYDGIFHSLEVPTRWGDRPTIPATTSSGCFPPRLRGGVAAERNSGGFAKCFQAPFNAI